MKKKQEVYPT